MQKGLQSMIASLRKQENLWILSLEQGKIHGCVLTEQSILYRVSMFSWNF